MSLALPAAVLLLLVLPGFLAVQGFLGRIGRKSVDPVGQAGLTWTWIIALPIAAALHAIWCNFLVPLFSSDHADLGATLAVLSGVSPEKAGWAEVKSAVIGKGGNIFWYFFSIYAGSALIGIAVRRIVRGLRLDIFFRLFRFANPWEYLFSGEQRLIELLGEPQAMRLPIWRRYLLMFAWEAPLVMLTASVQVGQNTYIYAGFLKEWGSDAKGEPHWIRLGAARRREITDDKAAGEEEDKSWERFYKIAGFGVVLWCEDISSLNIVYSFVSVGS